MKLIISNKTAFSYIFFSSIIIIIFLFWLIYFRDPKEIETSINLDFLPSLNALLNFFSALSLSLGFLAIKNGKKKLHLKMMLTALVFSSLFLVSYLVYHTFHGDTPYLEQGLIRYFYFFILISHVLLSVIVLPLIMITVFYAASKNFSIHPKIARITLPIWMYVSITGVLVYLMLHVL